MTWEGDRGGRAGSSPRLTPVKMSLYLNQTNSCCDPQIWKKGTISGHNPLSLTARSLFLDYNEDKSSIWFTSRPHGSRHGRTNTPSPRERLLLINLLLHQLATETPASNQSPGNRVSGGFFSVLSRPLLVLLTVVYPQPGWSIEHSGQ